MTPEERRLAMFHRDRSRLLDAEVFLFVLDGRVPDEGACVELGIAYCQKYLQNGEKLLVGLHTDIGAAFTPGRRVYAPGPLRGRAVAISPGSHPRSALGAAPGGRVVLRVVVERPVALGADLEAGPAPVLLCREHDRD
jgi:hypothetical protein